MLLQFATILATLSLPATPTDPTMPALANPRHEAFAQARARGAYLEDAYEDAGFAPGHGHASRLARTTCIVERIAELRAQKVDLDEARTHALIGGLLRLAKA